MLIGGIVTVFALREEDEEYEEGTEDIQSEDEEEVMPSLGDSRGPQGPHAAILTRLLLACAELFILENLGCFLKFWKSTPSVQRNRRLGVQT